MEQAIIRLIKLQLVVIVKQSQILQMDFCIHLKDLDRLAQIVCLVDIQGTVMAS
jgi:hypothetical protein